ncbi:hypothetical protein [Neomesorhizobium albiziae]|nr:hypothetical protein [Mesorhizobium albiziae]
MKAASTLNLLALGACFLVQSSVLELSGMAGIRRAIQTIEARAEPQVAELRSAVDRGGRPMPEYARHHP